MCCRRRHRYSSAARHVVENAWLKPPLIHNGEVPEDPVGIPPLSIDPRYGRVGVAGQYGAGNVIVSHKTAGDAVLPKVGVRKRVQSEDLGADRVDATRHDLRAHEATRELRQSGESRSLR